ncbi:MAG: glycosyltransferase family 2 protein [Deltaproteobacteria bacterium]|nr:glycosyltransferase family 2 protein [Deltaproteobacteria bacterium]
MISNRPTSHAPSDAPAEREAGGAFVSVIIPVLNERESIGLVLRDLPGDIVEQVIVVDNGSADDSAVVAERAGARVVRQPRRGYGAACLAGIDALDPRTDVIVFLDGDYSDFPEELEDLVRPVLQGEADLVIGSRVIKSASRRALLPQAYWGNKLATFLIQIFWKFNYTDLGPFRAIRRSSFDALGMRDATFGWTVEMQIKALRKGLRVKEVPVSYRKRIGQSKISGTVGGSLRAGAKIVMTIFRYGLMAR